MLYDVYFLPKVSLFFYDFGDIELFLCFVIAFGQNLELFRVALGLAAGEATRGANCGEKVEFDTRAKRQNDVFDVWSYLVFLIAFKNLLIFSSSYLVKNKIHNEGCVESGVSAVKPSSDLHDKI